MKTSRSSSATALAESPSSSARPSHEKIAERARALWREHGCPSGRDEEIWLEAERQLSGVSAAQAAETRETASTEKFRRREMAPMGAGTASGGGKGNASVRLAKKR